MKILESCIRYLDENNFFVTRIPRCVLGSPESVVETGIMHPSMCAGISIGRCRVSVPDVLLGFLDTDGRWHWACPERRCCINVSVCVRRCTPPEESWPVWLTITDLQSRASLQKGPPYIDVLRILMRYKRAQFWNDAFEEFIRTTWHPSRLDWCLDTEEHRDFFGAKKNHRVYHVHGNHHPRCGKLLA